MFSFPNKDRRLEWITNAVTRRSSSSVNTDTNLPLYHTTGSGNSDIGVRNNEGNQADGGRQRDRSASVGSLILLDESLLEWQPPDPEHNAINNADCQDDADTPFKDVGKGITSEGVTLQKFRRGENYGCESGNERLIMGGVILGAVALPVDENDEEREIVRDHSEGESGDWSPSRGNILETVNEKENDIAEHPSSGSQGDQNSGKGEEKMDGKIIRRESSVGVIGGNAKTFRDAAGGKGLGSDRKFKKRGGEGGRWEAQRGGGYFESQLFARRSKVLKGEKMANDTPKAGANTKGKQAIGESDENVVACNENLNELASGVTENDSQVGLENGNAVQFNDQQIICDGDQDAREGGDRDPARGNDVDFDGEENLVADGAQEALSARPSAYLRDYHWWLYIFGITAYTPGGNEQSMNWWDLIPRLAQKLLCVVVLSASAYRSLCQSKIRTLYFLNVEDDNKYINFIQMCYNISYLIISLFAAYLLVIVKEKFEKMLHSMEEYENTYPPDGSHGKKNWKRKLLAVLALTTLGIAVGRTLAQASKNGMEDLILSSSQEYAEDIYIWSSVNLTATTAKLEPEYSTVLDGRAKLFGGIVIFRDGIFYFHMGLLLDLVIVVGVVLYNYVSTFMKEVREITPNVPRRNVMEWTQLQARREAAWHKYRMLRLVVDDSNDVFDPLLKPMHVGNLLMYCFIMILIIFKNQSWIGNFLFMIYLVKAEIGYHIDGKIAIVNDVVRDWIRSWGWSTGKIEVDGEEIDAAMILDELDKKPMGLGKGKFLIHQFFHLKFLGIVLSVFFSMADDIRSRVGA